MKKRLRLAIVVGACAIGCASDTEDGRDEPENVPNGAENGNPNTPAGCSGEFARAPAPYSPNNAIAEWGGFHADARGLVFTAIPDTTLTNAPEQFPNALMTSDTAGNIATIYREESGMISNMVVDGDDVYFSTLIGSLRLMHVPRGGGDATVLVDRDVRSEPVTDGERLYYHGIADGLDHGIFAIDKSGGTPELLTTRVDKVIVGFAIEDDTLYWMDSDGYLMDTDHVLYRMPLDSREPEAIATVPRDAGGALHVIDGIVYSSLLADSFNFEVYRIEAGTAPVLLEDRAGAPLVFGDGAVYYASYSGGLTKTTLNFDNATTVSATSGKAISAIALGPTDLWYSSQNCIYRTTK